MPGTRGAKITPASRFITEVTRAVGPPGDQVHDTVLQNDQVCQVDLLDL